jgi:hypothetical protein
MTDAFHFLTRRGVNIAVDVLSIVPVICVSPPSNEKVHSILQAVMFQPGRWLKIEVNDNIVITSDKISNV